MLFRPVVCENIVIYSVCEEILETPYTCFMIFPPVSVCHYKERMYGVSTEEGGGVMEGEGRKREGRERREGKGGKIFPFTSKAFWQFVK
jgi:hypothetical protein